MMSVYWCLLYMKERFFGAMVPSALRLMLAAHQEPGTVRGRAS